MEGWKPAAGHEAIIREECTIRRDDATICF